MKKIITLILCLLLAISVSACKDNAEKSNNTAGGENKVEEKGSFDTADDEKSSNEANAEDKKSDGETNAEVNVTGEEVIDMVNEFNETDDPERKEELRKELEAILSQMDEAASTTVSE